MGLTTEEILLRKATHGGRNLTVIAFLSTLATAGYCIFAFSKTPHQYAEFTAAALILVSVGQWALAASARRGEPNAVTVALLVFILQFAVTLVSEIMAASEDGSAFKPKLIPLLVLMLIIASLYQSRAILVQIRCKGLSEKAFPSGKNPRFLYLSGAWLVLLGVVAANSCVIMAERAGRTQEEGLAGARKFASVLKHQSKHYDPALQALFEDTNLDTHAAADTQLEQLLQMTFEARGYANADPDLLALIGDYEDAIVLWDAGLDELIKADADINEANRKFHAAQQIRVQIVDQYNARYVTP